MKTHIAKRKEMTEKRNLKVKARFRKLYEKDRLRLDDVITRLSEEFCLAPLTIERILSK